MKCSRSECATFDHYLYTIITDKVDRMFLVHTETDLVAKIGGYYSGIVIEYMEEENHDLFVEEEPF